MADFITLTGLSGPDILLNTDQVSHVRERGNDNKPTQVSMANGTDFEVAETYEDVAAQLQADA